MILLQSASASFKRRPSQHVDLAGRGSAAHGEFQAGTSQPDASGAAATASASLPPFEVSRRQPAGFEREITRRRAPPLAALPNRTFPVAKHALAVSSDSWNLLYGSKAEVMTPEASGDEAGGCNDVDSEQGSDVNHPWAEGWEDICAGKTRCSDERGGGERLVGAPGGAGQESFPRVAADPTAGGRAGRYTTTLKLTGAAAAAAALKLTSASLRLSHSPATYGISRRRSANSGARVQPNSSSSSSLLRCASERAWPDFLSPKVREGKGGSTSRGRLQLHGLYHDPAAMTETDAAGREVDAGRGAGRGRERQGGRRSSGDVLRRSFSVAGVEGVVQMLGEIEEERRDGARVKEEGKDVAMCCGHGGGSSSCYQRVSHTTYTHAEDGQTETEQSANGREGMDKVKAIAHTVDACNQEEDREGEPCRNTVTEQENSPSPSQPPAKQGSPNADAESVATLDDWLPDGHTHHAGGAGSMSVSSSYPPCGWWQCSLMGTVDLHQKCSRS